MNENPVVLVNSHAARPSSSPDKTMRIAVALFATLILAWSVLTACRRVAKPAAEQLDWLKRNVIPIATVEAGHGFADLQALKEIIGDARIVSLGESTHGNREIFQMKHRLVEYLAGELGFTILYHGSKSAGKPPA